MASSQASWLNTDGHMNGYITLALGAEVMGIVHYKRMMMVLQSICRLTRPLFCVFPNLPQARKDGRRDEEPRGGRGEGLVRGRGPVHAVGHETELGQVATWWQGHLCEVRTSSKTLVCWFAS